MSVLYIFLGAKATKMASSEAKSFNVLCVNIDDTTRKLQRNCRAFLIN